MLFLEQAANGVYTLKQREAMNTEANALAAEYNRIVQTTELNGIKVLDTTQNGGSLSIQAGCGADGVLAFRVGEELARSVGDGSFTLTTSYPAPTDYYISEAALGDINGDGILDMVVAGIDDSDAGCALVRIGNGDGTFRADVFYQAEPGYIGDFSTSFARVQLGNVGSFESRLEFASNVLQVTRENYLAANSRIEDVDIAEESAALVHNQILEQAAAAVLAQANQTPALAIELLRGI